jgi:hypothetical protein
MISTLSFKMSLDATSAALVGSLAVSTSFNLDRDLLARFLDHNATGLVDLLIARSSAQGEASPKEAKGPVDGFDDRSVWIQALSLHGLS